MRIAAKIGITVVLLVAGAASIGALEHVGSRVPHPAIGWAVVGGLMLLTWLPKWSGGRTSVAAATNVVLAEHVLSFVELTANNPLTHQLAQQIVATLRRSGSDGVEEAEVAARFNGLPRPAQLNLIAAAMINLEQSAMSGEQWEPVPNPPSEAPSGASIAAASEYLRNKHGVSIVVPDRPFRIENGCLLDANSPTTAPAAFLPPPDLLRQAIYGSFAFFLEQTKDEKVDYNEFHLLVLKSFVTAISVPVNAPEPIVALARFADLPTGWEQWTVSAIVDQLFRLVRDQIYK